MQQRETTEAPRTLTLTGPAGSDPAPDRVRLQAFPGALALLVVAGLAAYAYAPWIAGLVALVLLAIVFAAS